ncbi:MAG: NAD-dependent epimerase/dehydratase family protein [Terriglobia bacterium]
MSWLEKTIFVTGATGFIGGRVCERLVQAGARDVRALVHSVQRSPRIARLPIRLCPGNLLERTSLRDALGDAQVVIHCGLGDARGILRGTENMLRAAESRGVQRFVHMSTAAVYGYTPPPGSETEDAPIRPTGDTYCDNKVRAERAVNRYGRRGLPVVILRPSIVYGPYSFWSTRLLGELRAGEVALIDDGAGACNTTHVDNLIDAIFLCLDKEQSVGKTFFITDGERVTWGAFIHAHVAMLGWADDLPRVSSADLEAYYKAQPGIWAASVREARRVIFSPELRRLLMRIPACERMLVRVWGRFQAIEEGKKERLRSRLRGNGARRVLPASNFRPDRITLATQTGTVYFSIEKARTVLGYEPRVPFPAGIRAVEQWLRYASYL